MDYEVKKGNHKDFGNLIAPGIHKFSIVKAIEKKYSDGISYIQICFKVENENEVYWVYDFLKESQSIKIKYFWQSINLAKNYESGKIEVEDCLGQTGFFEISHSFINSKIKPYVVKYLVDVDKVNGVTINE
jgi:hypothetical protein